MVSELRPQQTQNATSFLQRRTLRRRGGLLNGKGRCTAHRCGLRVQVQGLEKNDETRFDGLHGDEEHWQNTDKEKSVRDLG